MRPLTVVLPLFTVLTAGCATRSVRVELQSAKNVYAVGEPLQLQVGITAGKHDVRLVDAIYFTHWRHIEWSEPGENPSGGGGSLPQSLEQKAFEKPIEKWSKLPCVVVEYETVTLFETDCYPLPALDMPSAREPIVTVAAGQTHRLTRTLEGDRMECFWKPGRYIFRATLHQPKSWENRVVEVASDPITIEIRR